MSIRIDREGARRPRAHLSALVLAVPLGLAPGGSDVGLRVNHDLAPGESLFGWGLDAEGRRVIYAVDRHDFDGRQLFSAAADGSQEVFALTDLLPNGRTISNWDLAADGRFVAFVADLDTDGQDELYSVPTDGSRTVVKLSNPLPADADVLTLHFTPDGSRVLYLTAVPFSGRNTLNSAPADGSEPAVVIDVPAPGVYGFLADHGTSDGRHVLYWSRPDRILSAPTDGSAPPLQISPTPESDSPSNAYRLSPDGQWIVFFSPNSGGSDVFSARVDGSAPARPLFFRGEAGTAAVIQSATPQAFQITGDSRFVVGMTSDFREIRVAPIDGTSRPVVLTEPENVFRSNFRVTRDERVVFEASPWGLNALRQRGIYTVPMDGSARVQKILGARGDPLPIKHEVNSRGDVVFVALDNSWELFRVSIDGGPFQRLNPPMVPGGMIDGGNVINSPSFVFSPDGVWVLYTADQERDNVTELFVVPADGSRASQKLSDPLPADGDVLSYAFAPDSRRVLYGRWTSTTREVFTSLIGNGLNDGPSALAGDLGPASAIPRRATLVESAAFVRDPTAGEVALDPDVEPAPALRPRDVPAPHAWTPLRARLARVLGRPLR